MSTEKTPKQAAEAFAKTDRVHPHDKHGYAFLDSVMEICVRENRKVKSVRSMSRFIQKEWPTTIFGDGRISSYLRKNHSETYGEFYERT